MLRKLKFQREADPEWARQVSERPGCEGLFSCLQCGACSGTCPLSIYMDFSPAPHHRPGPGRFPPGRAELPDHLAVRILLLLRGPLSPPDPHHRHDVQPEARGHPGPALSCAHSPCLCWRRSSARWCGGAGAAPSSGWSCAWRCASNPLHASRHVAHGLGPDPHRPPVSAPGAASAHSPDLQRGLAPREVV